MAFSSSSSSIISSEDERDLIDIDTLSVCSSLSPSPACFPPQHIPFPSPSPLLLTHFYETQFLNRLPTWKDLSKLEFYQVFPHDSAATLCLHHFLQLAEPWFRRRRGYPETETHRLAAQFPHARIQQQQQQACPAPRDAQVMALVVRRDAWRRKPVDELMEDLRVEVLAAEQHLRYDRRDCIRRHGRAPSCGLGDPATLACGFCAAIRFPGARSIYEKMELVRRKGGGHGAFRQEEMELVDEDGDGSNRGPAAGRSRAEPWLDAAHAYRSVGGLHFLVDACDGRVMIKFASTKASATDRQACWIVGEGAFVDRHMFDRPGAFDLTVCSAGDGRCACQAGRNATVAHH